MIRENCKCDCYAAYGCVFMQKKKKCQKFRFIFIEFGCFFSRSLALFVILFARRANYIFKHGCKNKCYLWILRLPYSTDAKTDDAGILTNM